MCVTGEREVQVSGSTDSEAGDGGGVCEKWMETCGSRTCVKNMPTLSQLAFQKWVEICEWRGSARKPVPSCLGQCMRSGWISRSQAASCAAQQL
eukprot:1137968-Pelagomonas_calceolata.AAC.3